MTNLESLATQFNVAMFAIYDRANKECGYRPTAFRQMLHEHGGLQTANTLINKSQPSDGFTRLWELQRLDLTVEALVLEQPWSSLFLPEELERARIRLAQYGYSPHPKTI